MAENESAFEVAAAIARRDVSTHKSESTIAKDRLSAAESSLASIQEEARQMRVQQNTVPNENGVLNTTIAELMAVRNRITEDFRRASSQTMANMTAYEDQILRTSNQIAQEKADRIKTETHLDSALSERRLETLKNDAAMLL